MVHARISEKTLRGWSDDSNIVHGLEGMRRLLMQEDAVHAVSWGLAADTAAAAGAGAGAGRAPSPTTLLHLTRRERGATTSRVALRALLRKGKRHFGECSIGPLTRKRR